MNQDTIYNVIIAFIFVIALAAVLPIVIDRKSKPAPITPIIPTKWQAETHRKLRAALQEAVDEAASDGIRARLEALSNASLPDILANPGDYCDAIESVMAEDVDEEDDCESTSDHLDEAWHFAVALSDSIDWPESTSTNKPHPVAQV